MAALSSSGAVGAAAADAHGRSCNWLPEARRNLSDWDRWISLAAGGGMLIGGLRRRSLAGVMVGGGLLVRGATGCCPIYRVLGIDHSAGTRHSHWVSVPAGRGVRIDERLFIRRAVSDVFDFWQNFENLPHVMDHLQSVQRVGTSRTHWVARGPLGITAEWDAEIINQRPNQLIAWRSLPGGDLDTAGSVRFSPSPAGFGTFLRLELKYDPPGGRLGATLAWLLGEDPRRQIRHDLTRLKELLEGENEFPERAPASTRKAK